VGPTILSGRLSAAKPNLSSSRLHLLISAFTHEVEPRFQMKNNCGKPRRATKGHE